jgi:putative transposase
MSLSERRAMIEKGNTGLSRRRQCALLGVSRSGFYHRPRGPSAEDLEVMRALDGQYLKTPFYGARRMVVALRGQGFQVGRERVGRLMAVMGLEALAPGPQTSRRRAGHPVYPYLLKGLDIGRPNQVWASDITYIPMDRGFLYLVAILDWATRYVLAWRLSATLDADFCIDALEAALAMYGTPEIVNTDQGAQFTGREWIATVEAAGARVSMDAKGAYRDNIFIERLWRTVKYEDVYLHDYADGAEAKRRLKAYFDFYNHHRPHQSLGYRTPAEVYFEAARSSATGPVDMMDKARALPTYPQAQPQQVMI